MKQKYAKLPHISQVLEELGLIEPTAFTKALRTSWKAPKKMNYEKACRKLNITVYQMKKILKNGENHEFRKNPKAKDQRGITVNAAEQILSNQALREQAGMTLSARAIQINEKFNSNLNRWDLAKLYKGNNINRKQMVCRLGKPVLQHQVIQQMVLDTAKNRYLQLKEAGYHIVQIDECLFNADHHRMAHWSRPNEQLVKIQRYKWVPRVVVFGAISEERGHIYYKYGIRSFDQNDTIDMLRSIRQTVGSGRLAVFLDNASIHTAERVRVAAAKDDINIELAFNAPYRPDCNGIEYLWSLMKIKYRRYTDHMKARNIQYDNQGLIEQIQGEIDNQKVINSARRGWQNLLNAVAIDPLEHEEQPMIPQNLEPRAGPERYYGDPSVSSEEEIEQIQEQ